MPRAGFMHINGLRAGIDNDKIITQPMHLVKFANRHPRRFRDCCTDSPPFILSAPYLALRGQPTDSLVFLLTFNSSEFAPMRKHIFLYKESPNLIAVQGLPIKPTLALAATKLL